MSASKGDSLASWVHLAPRWGIKALTVSHFRRRRGGRAQPARSEKALSGLGRAGAAGSRRMDGLGVIRQPGGSAPRSGRRTGVCRAWGAGCHILFGCEDALHNDCFGKQAQKNGSHKEPLSRR